MTRRLSTLLVVGLIVLGVIGPASAAIRISKVQYDSPGSDYGSNSSLKAEWVKIKNTGGKAKSLSGWTLRDKAGHVYNFGSFKLKAGRTVTVHTGSGSDSAKHLYQDSGAYIWNNDGDTAKLKNDNGKLIDKCSWAGGESPNPPAAC
jgi:hypothetical protein